MEPYQQDIVRKSRLVSELFRMLALAVSRTPLLLLVLLIASPIGPHVRLEYRYVGHGQHVRILDCSYLGSRGVIHRAGHHNCSFINIIDGRVKN